MPAGIPRQTCPAVDSGEMAKVDQLEQLIDSTPPGELSNVLAAIQNIAPHHHQIAESFKPALRKYNEEQYAVARLPGGTDEVILSSHNALGQDRYYDFQSRTSFSYDHVKQSAADARPHSLDTTQSSLLDSLTTTFSSYVREHYPSAALGVYPTDGDSRVALLIVSNKYSPNNFWNGRWRSEYVYDPSSGTLEGSVRVDVHYYEDANVRLLTDKQTSAALSGPTSDADAVTQRIVKQIAGFEKSYQQDLNLAFVELSEGAFKSLRRQLPITRQKVDWDKIGGYRLGQDLGGGRLR